MQLCEQCLWVCIWEIVNISSQKLILTVFVVYFLKVEIHEHFSFMQPALADEFQSTYNCHQYKPFATLMRSSIVSLDCFTLKRNLIYGYI